MKINLLILIILIFSHSKNANAQTWTSLPENMYADTLFAPFYHGVASGDPLNDAVVIWTRITPNETQIEPISLSWQIATDSLFIEIVQVGNGETNSSIDWTFKHDVTDLEAATVYYYRFEDENGNFSPIGRTKTAPTNNDNTALKMAVASCSSIYSGFFNAYRRIGERNDLDLFIHLGDYLYDVVDENEEVRVPSPYPQAPNSLETWRQRHLYHLLDPDLRFVRQQQPILALWDNHDMDDDDISISVQAFHEYLPTRESNIPIIRYQMLHYGDLLDILLLDILLFRNIDPIPGGGFSMMGNTQYEWAKNELLNSTAKWRIVASQNMMGTWSTMGLPDLPVFEDDVFDPTSWDGFPAERERFLQFWKNNNISNNIVISGDSHVSMAMDLTLFPLDSLTYNGDTGEGSLGVEILPTSISRGNIDELGLPISLAENAVNLSMEANPHHVYEELTSHGYGILNIEADSVRAEFWYSPILEISNEEVLAKSLVVLDGENHWKREDIVGLSENVTRSILGLEVSNIYPNPAKNEQISCKVLAQKNTHYTFEIVQLATGKKVFETEKQMILGQQETIFDFDVKGWKSGVYVLLCKVENEVLARKFFVE
ncbi:MAG: alkaline phosphatase D family protein [Chitinophagales bacterium]